MQALWNNMAKSWPIVAPAPVFVERVGESVVQRLGELRMLRREALQPGSRYPCDGCTRGREVVVHEGIWAVCTCEPAGCERIDVSSTDMFALDGRALVGHLRELLCLDGPTEPLRWSQVSLLGERRIGNERVIFGLAPRPQCVSSDRLSLWLARHTARVTILLAPTRNSRPSTTPASKGQVLWLSLDQVIDLHTGSADLSELPIRLQLAGANLGELLWPRFALVVDPVEQRFYYAGQALDIERRPRLVELLRILAARPNQWVCRRDLVLGLYPDEITNRGKLLTDPGKIERRLRQLVSDLGKAFKAVDSRGLPTNPIENLRARSDLEGGYRLGLPPRQVFICDSQ